MTVVIQELRTCGARNEAKGKTHENMTRDSHSGPHDTRPTEFGPSRAYLACPLTVAPHAYFTKRQHSRTRRSHHADLRRGAQQTRVLGFTNSLPYPTLLYPPHAARHVRAQYEREQYPTQNIVSTHVGVSQDTAKVANPKVLALLVPPVQPVEGYESHGWRRTCFGRIFQVTKMVLGGMAVGLCGFQIAVYQSPQRDRSRHLIFMLVGS